MHLKSDVLRRIFILAARFLPAQSRTRVLRERLVLAVTLLALWQPPMHAQELVSVKRPLGTEPSPIALRRRLALTPPIASVSDLTEVIFHTQSGSWVLGPLGPHDSQLDVFDTQGRFVRSITSFGDVDLRRIGWIQFDAAGQIVVNEVHNNQFLRGTLDGALRARMPMPVELLYPVFFQTGVFVANGSIATDASVGHPLHVFDANGALRRSFGEVAGQNTLPGFYYRRMRALGRAGANTFWACLPNRYEVQLWSIEGKMLRTLRSTPSWFTPWERDPTQQADVARPLSHLKAVHQDSAGLLWLMFQVPDAHWQPSRTAGTSAGRVGADSHAHIDETAIPLLSKGKYYDTIIEVVEPTTGALVASQRFDQLFHPFLADGSVSRYEANAGGQLSLVVSQLSLDKLPVKRRGS